MKSWILFNIYEILWIFTLPFIYLFGHLKVFQNTIIIFQSIFDTLGIYFLVFLFVIIIVFFRNYMLQIFNKKFFKNFLKNNNVLLFNNYIKFSYKSIYNSIMLLINKFFFLKKKNNI